jgi:type III pantothenate kinase
MCRIGIPVTRREKDNHMLLAIDIGNTNITMGIYEGEKMLKAWRMATDHERMPDEYGLQITGLIHQSGFDKALVREAAIASVVPPLTSIFSQACESYLGVSPFIVDAGVRTGLKIRYEDPKHALGADRVVDAVAVLRLYGGPACVVDFGTATTFDAISGDGEYLGGAISPGIGIAADALFMRTSKLPRVDLVRPPGVIGRNTVHAIQSGLLFGYVGLVEGMTSRFRKELGVGMKVIGTGGLAQIIADETDVIEIVAPWLTLDGLRMVWELNQ